MNALLGDRSFDKCGHKFWNILLVNPCTIPKIQSFDTKNYNVKFQYKMKLCTVYHLASILIFFFFLLSVAVFVLFGPKTTVLMVVIH